MQTSFNPDRSFTVLADSLPVSTPGAHLRLTGRHTQSLYPDLFLLRFWNPSDAAAWQLRNAHFLEVSHGETLLASGEIAEITQETAAEGELLTVSFAPGLSFRSAGVSLSVPAGVNAADTVRMLLAAAGSPARLLNDPGPNPVFARPQAFHGRLSEAVEAVLSACGAVPYLVPAGIAVCPASAVPAGLYIDMDTVSGPWIREEM
ncbi:MAG: hypothetical protein IJJ42_00375 [Clostridia bacterium]|nr:hypothetical protein [Clostridia bacterium]